MSHLFLKNKDNKINLKFKSFSMTMESPFSLKEEDKS